MFRELIEYYLTPTSREARKSGYLYEAIAFESRAQRNFRHWQPHWANCQQLVKEFVAEHSKAQSLCILGSGCLFEVPKDLLVQKFEKICLVDRVFPRSVRSWIKKQDIEIEMREMDLSQNFPSDLGCDLLISANLLSQLSLPFEEMSERRKVQRFHLEKLQQSGCSHLLWTDVERVYSEVRSKDVFKKEPTVFCSLPEALKNWNWKIAPAPELHRQVDVSLKMQAFVGRQITSWNVFCSLNPQ